MGLAVSELLPSASSREPKTMRQTTDALYHSAISSEGGDLKFQADGHQQRTIPADLVNFIQGTLPQQYGWVDPPGPYQPGFDSWKPQKEFLTVHEVAVILGFGDDFIRSLVVALLDVAGVLVPGVDVLEVPPKPNARRTVRKNFRQFRIHKGSGVGKIKAHLAPKGPSR
jgi:hypothetical protein